MARSIADKIIDANRAGKEAQFESNGVTYTFDPEGLKAYIAAEGGNQTVSWNDIQDKPTTFPPVIGTTANTAKAGNYQPTWSQVTGKPSTFPPTIGTTADTAKAGDYQPAWGEISGKPATFPPTIGTTSDTAKAGNYQPTWAQVTGKPTTFTPAAHTHAPADITGVDLAALKSAIDGLDAGTATVEDIVTALQNL